jgi:AraC-like DNA-binding protein
VDALSDVLRVVRLSGGVFLDARFSEPWAVISQVGPEDCRPSLPAPAHVLAYHYVVDGRMQVELDGATAVTVGAGEAVMLPRNDRHVLASGAGLVPVLADLLVRPPEGAGLATLRHGGGGATTHVVCGFVGCEMRRHPLVDTLPRVMTVDLRSGPAGAWFDSLFRWAPGEAAVDRPGSAIALSRMSELLFVEAVRRHVDALPPDRTGWLAGLRDPVVGRALALMHERVAEPWTVDALARAVHLSRSAFAQRFVALLGVPPLAYLTEWRMQLAMQRLRDGRAVGQVAGEVGYDSEAAFSRAFKREVGVAPASWREAAAG